MLKCCNAEMIHTQILKFGFGKYPVVQTSLLDSYWRFGSDFLAAQKVFDEMTERNVVTWTAMISGYARVGQMGSAILLFEGMVERDTPSWNAVIAGCTQNGLLSEAISLFRRMVGFEKEGQNGDIKPNTVTLVCVLSACGHTGMLHLGRSIQGYIYRHGLDPDRFISNALVDMYGKCGNLIGARRVFDTTPVKGLTLWNSMINSFALHGQSKEAINIFEDMIRCGNGVNPDNVTFVGLLNACTHGGLVNEGRAYFNSMIKDYKIEPQIQHYGCLIDLLGRAGKLDKAMEVIKNMRVPTDEVIWGSLLNGCKIHNRIDLAELAAKKLVEIDPSNGGYGIMLANTYVETGKWDEVGKVRKMLKDTDAHKTPGCSWIEVDNRVHQFYSVDITHPRTEEIYAILETLFDFSQ